MEWISVNDSLPEKDVLILFYDGETIRFGEYVWYGQYENDYRWYDELYHKYITDITHWMPLPKPPE